MSILRSLARPDWLATLIRERYGLAVDSVVLVRSFVNDVYRVRSGSGDQLLKVYRHGGPSVDEVAWEVALTRHLTGCGIRVPQVRDCLDGGPVPVIDFPEGPRPVTLSEYVVGDKPRPPFDDALYRRFGVAVAELHEAARGFVCELPRRPYDLDGRILAPLRRVLVVDGLAPADRELVERAAALATGRLTSLLPALEPGVRHGDVTLDNLLLAGDSMIIYDFDLAGPGPLVDDLTGVAGTPQWPAFLAGYRTVRDLDDDQLAALPWLRIAATIEHLDFHLIRKPAILGSETLGEGWVSGNLEALKLLVP
ncbi:phosphotransferase enzyme family protein [Microlunatus parietis]|uniref:Ser/Thr protein kinase RdoA (MazF antagonist) n=1 Tax=Microlunatus parietis TaxID=682979 RepID=A0A7Y9I8B3_9ACTN|nr:phosphotransferase [Microlunatus parietis]NYE72174.1 Ser/Thr protein kinase RdoA (MazF antagonist) [Microlunatus parietis]